MKAPFAVIISCAPKCGVDHFLTSDVLAEVVVAPCVRVHALVAAAKMWTSAESASFRAITVTVSSRASAVVGARTKVILYGVCPVPRPETVFPLLQTMDVARLKETKHAMNVSEEVIARDIECTKSY